MLSSGGEIVRAKRDVKGTLHESLHMTVAIPFLFGVPPAHEMLRCGFAVYRCIVLSRCHDKTSLTSIWTLRSGAIAMGGGIIDRVSRQWYMY